MRRAACVGPGACTVGIAIGSWDEMAGAGDGSIAEPSDGAIEGTGEGASGVTVGGSVAVRLPFAVVHRLDADPLPLEELCCH